MKYCSTATNLAARILVALFICNAAAHSQENQNVLPRLELGEEYVVYFCDARNGVTNLTVKVLSLGPGEWIEGEWQIRSPRKQDGSASPKLVNTGWINLRSCHRIARTPAREVSVK